MPLILRQNRQTNQLTKTAKIKTITNLIYNINLPFNNKKYKISHIKLKKLILNLGR